MVFDPTDEELVSNFLIEKASGASEGELSDFIKYIALYQHAPSQLRSLAQDSGHEKWYFFTHLEKKYQQGRNINRQVPGGYWQKTCPPSLIKDKAGNTIAKKTSLTYYKKDRTSAQPEKTKWLMKEYMLENQPPNIPNDKESEMLTLCYIYRSKHHRRTTNRRRNSDVNN
ncbi:NAC domain protein [Melia azedarach]|nr:NAC domain protein [Melia azedarach]